MLIDIVCNLLLIVITVRTFQIPYIDNASFISISNSNSLLINNQTCEQCLCLTNVSYLALNCFPNNTCQFFLTYSRTYKIQSSLQTRLYFLQKIFPNTSQCCMPDTSYLMNRLRTAIPISINVSSSCCLILDNHGYLVTVSESNFTMIRFYSTSTTSIY